MQEVAVGTGGRPASAPASLVASTPNVGTPAAGPQTGVQTSTSPTRAPAVPPAPTLASYPPVPAAVLAELDPGEALRNECYMTSLSALRQSVCLARLLHLDILSLLPQNCSSACCLPSQPGLLFSGHSLQSVPHVCIIVVAQHGWHCQVGVQSLSMLTGRLRPSPIFCPVGFVQLPVLHPALSQPRCSSCVCLLALAAGLAQLVLVAL